MNASLALSRTSPAVVPAAVAARWFLNDVAMVSGFSVDLGKRAVSRYVMGRPILTSPDPWFFAGLVALESAKICNLFSRAEAGALLHEISSHVDTVVGRRGKGIAKVVFALMGRLGYGAILMRMKVPDPEIGRVIRILLGGTKDWKDLLPSVKAHHQVCKALALGTPSWWVEYVRAREARTSKDKPKETAQSAPRIGDSLRPRAGTPKKARTLSTSK